MVEPAWVWKRDKEQRDIDRADEHLERINAWERRLLSDEAARNRKLEDDEERRMLSVFEVEWEDPGDESVEGQR